MKLSVFCSYSYVDFQLRDSIELGVQKILLNSELRANFITDRFGGIRAGADIEDWIEDSIIESDVLLTLLTPASLGSWWVALELMLARRYDRQILAAADTAARADRRMPEWLKGANMLEAPSNRNADDIDRLVAQIANALKQLPGQSVDKERARIALEEGESKTALNSFHRK